MRPSSRWVKISGCTAGPKHGGTLVSYWRLVAVFPREGEGTGTMG